MKESALDIDVIVSRLLVHNDILVGYKSQARMHTFDRKTITNVDSIGERYPKLAVLLKIEI